MNIFVLSDHPVVAAQQMCNKHVVKMIVESCQLMSTAHHILDGNPITRITKNGRKYKTFECIPTEGRLLKCTMPNHPCTIWTRETSANYNWLFLHTIALINEYRQRYNKNHAYINLLETNLSKIPVNIKKGNLTPFAQAMPEQYRHENAVIAYRAYYINEKNRFAKWPDGKVPSWYTEGLERINTNKQVQT